MSTLYDQIKSAEKFQPSPQDGPVRVDQSGAADFAMKWASRQTPQTEQPAVQLKPIVAVAN